MIKKNIPNTITLGNLFCGCLALVQAFNGNLVEAAYFVGISLVLDFFDGFAARLLNVTSAIGKDLDSLADMVTFGVVPGVVMFAMLNNTVPADLNANNLVVGMRDTAQNPGIQPWSYFAFIITLFSCIRLAKFNNDTRQTGSFIGLPTPANTMLICSIPLINAFQPEYLFLTGLFSNLWFLLVLSVVMSVLLIAEIPLFALKFKTFGWQDNKLVYCFLAVSAISLISLKFAAIPLIILLYILLSIANNIFFKPAKS